MPVIFCLVDILTQFRPLFNRQNFALFCTFIAGLITHRHRATLTGIYQAVRPKSGYGSLSEVPFPWRLGRRCGCSTSD